MLNQKKRVMSDETKQKLRESALKRGARPSPEALKKAIEAIKNKPSWNKGLGAGFSIHDGYKRFQKSKGRKLEHRSIVEGILGREMSIKEIVHHVDEDKSNNSIENLQYFRLSAAHSRLHHFARRHKIVDMSVFKTNWQQIYGK